MTYLDLVKELLCVVKNPSAATLVLVLMLMTYALPVAASVYSSYQATQRLEQAVRDGNLRLEKTLNNLVYNLIECNRLKLLEAKGGEQR